MQVGLATSEYPHCSCVWCSGSRLLVPCVRACSGPTCLLSCGAASCPSLSVLSGSKASFRFTVHRTSFKAMHYAVDCLDLDVIFPTITGPVPLPFRTQVSSTTGTAGVPVWGPHILGGWHTYVHTSMFMYPCYMHQASCGSCEVCMYSSCTPMCGVMSVSFCGMPMFYPGEQLVA